jgi:arylsulfatase
MARNNDGVEAARKHFNVKCLYSSIPLLVLVLIVFGSLWYGHQVETFNLSYSEQLRSIMQPSAGAGGAKEDQSYRRRDQEEEEKKKEHEQLNIVLFYADDWTMKVLGKLNPHVLTPNIDQMADKGMLFTNNCVTTSMCWISRASLMTGVYASRHLELEPSSKNMFITNPWNETLFPLLKKAGYFTGIVGKWHAPQPVKYMKMAWDYTILYFGWHWMMRAKKMRHVTDLNREDALYFLKHRPKQKKFALKVSFFATHAWDGHYPSYLPMNSSKAELYQNVTIPRPKTATIQHWKQLPYFFNERNEARRRWYRRFEPHYFQDNIKDLYRMATEVDTVVGDIIAELKRQGVYNNTLLVFTTDNGNLKGEHGLVEKWYPFEESIRVPLVIQDPRMPKEMQGTTSDAWTLNVDLAPTLLGAANIPPSRFMQGRDIAQLYLDENPTWRKDFFYEYNLGDLITGADHLGKFWIDASFALVTNEWKYIYWPQHDYEQLFHRSVDPYDEWDLLNTSQIQTTDEVYFKMKARYAFLKDWVQSGKRI